MEPIDTSKLPIKVEYGGKTKRGDWPCYQWNVTVGAQWNNPHGFWTFPYYCGLGRVTKPKHSWMEPKPVRPSNDDILHSLILDAGAANMNFADWCSDYGYSDDSISALNAYRECLTTATMLRKHFGRDTLEALKLQLQDH
jgi:hypothetical protein